MTLPAFNPLKKQLIKFSKSLRFLFTHLVKERRSPCFEVPDSRQIIILKEPLDYYLALNKLIQSSKKRISMSALYVSSGQLEQHMLENLDKQIQDKGELRVNLLFDYMRGTREVKMSTKGGKNTYDMLKHMKQKEYKD